MIHIFKDLSNGCPFVQHYGNPIFDSQTFYSYQVHLILLKHRRETLPYWKEYEVIKNWNF